MSAGLRVLMYKFSFLTLRIIFRKRELLLDGLADGDRFILGAVQVKSFKLHHTHYKNHVNH